MYTYIHTYIYIYICIICSKQELSESKGLSDTSAPWSDITSVLPNCMGYLDGVTWDDVGIRSG